MKTYRIGDLGVTMDLTRRTRVALSRAALVTLAAACGAEPSLPADSGAGEGPPGAVRVTISGEPSAVTGFSFPPAAGTEGAFVDGWALHFDRILVTVDNVTLSENPDANPRDQSIVGEVVAGLNGPWAVDLHAGGPLPGKGGPAEQAVLLGVLSNQNKKGGEAFDTSRRYAFGFAIVPATTAAQKVNLDAEAVADYTYMVENKVAVLYVGSASWRGGAACSPSAPYDFTKAPTTVKFRFAFKTPTAYVNCQNPDLTGRPFAGEEKPRGIALKENAASVAQITIHTDHPFWSTVDHDAAELFFDQFAAYATVADGGVATVTLDALEAVDFTTFKDTAGARLPWRSCDASSAAKPGIRKFDSGDLPVDPSKPPAEALRNYADFVAYVQSTQGHLNADGLCAVKRRYPSPP